MLEPAGPSAHAIAQVWWWMFAVATVVAAGVTVLWLLAMRRGRTRAAADAGASGRAWLVWGGLVLPGVSIAALMLGGFPAGLHQMPLPGRTQGPAPLVVEVTARQWYWELHYPASGLRLRDELRLPVGQPIDLRVRSVDVIHSFWVPRLGGKLDAIPGRELRLRLQADEAGSFRGQCAEFCGTGHAHMVLTVHAMEPGAFEAWQQGAAAGARVAR